MRLIRLIIYSTVVLGISMLLVASSVFAFWLPPQVQQRITKAIITDDISITATPLSLPVVTNDGGASNILDNSARLNGEITSTGGSNPTVTVFYGQADGGTDPGSWSNNSSLGVLPLGLFYYNAAGLLPSTLYYYRMYAVNGAGPDWAPDSANFTTAGEILRAPTDFTLTRTDEYTVLATWTKGTASTYTVILLSGEAHPEDYTASLPSYNGTGASCNLSWPVDIIAIYASAWGLASDNVTYSADYATDDIGGEFMAQLADSMSSIAGFAGNITSMAMGFMAILILVLFTLLAFKYQDTQGSPVLFLVTACISLVTALNAPNIISGKYETTSLGLTVGLMLIIYTLGCAGWALKLMFWEGRGE